VRFENTGPLKHAFSDIMKFFPFVSKGQHIYDTIYLGI
jgi:hypothetical protein